MILLLQVPRAPGDRSSLSARADMTVRSGRQSTTSKPFTCFRILSGVWEGEQSSQCTNLHKGFVLWYE